MSPTNGDRAYDDERLVRYLLGALNDDETNRYDELSIVDSQFAVRLQSVEDDLLDSYARGALSGDTLDRFRSAYLSTPVLRDKVRFAGALLARQRAAAATVVSRPPRRAWLPALAAAAAAILLISAGYLFVMRTRTAAPEQAAVSPATVPTAKQPSTPPDQPPAPMKPTAPPGDAVLAFMLMPSRRGLDEPPVVAVPPGTAEIDVRVVLESDDFRRYGLALKDPATDRVIWRSARLPPSTWRDDRVVTARLETRSLKGQLYVFDLSGFPAAGEAQLVSSYPFRLVLR